jgi:hypothetical protein
MLPDGSATGAFLSCRHEGSTLYLIVAAAEGQELVVLQLGTSTASAGGAVIVEAEQPVLSRGPQLSESFGVWLPLMRGQ